MKKIPPVREVKVGLNFDGSVTSVGRLALRGRDIYFEYEPSFIKQGLEISMIRLPLKSGVINFPYSLFEGLPGVFNDSLPDGWGRLLFDRMARSHNILPEEISPLDRLISIGNHGLGALVYEPDHSLPMSSGEIRLDRLAEQTREVLEGTSENVLQELLGLNGSSAGARPKALIGLEPNRQQIIHGAADLPSGYEPWIVKFANTLDGGDAGAIEYVYSLMAKDAGITVPDTHLFPAQRGAGYFAVKRFDRNGKNRFHMHTVCGLLHADFRTPNLDYEQLLTLAGVLTRDVREVEKLFRLAAFNVLAHNRDDHGKNFSFLMNSDGQWKLSPAYDLTFSSGPRGEQSTTVMGEGQNPGLSNLKKLGIEANLSKPRIQEILEQTQAALRKWDTLANQHGVSKSNLELISKRFQI